MMQLVVFLAAIRDFKFVSPEYAACHDWGASPNRIGGAYGRRSFRAQQLLPMHAAAGWG